MKRMLLSLLITAVAAFVITASARDDWYDKPLEVAAGTVAIDTLGPGIDRAGLQVRAALPLKARGRIMSLRWGAVRATLHIPDWSDDPLYLVPDAVVRVDSLRGASVRPIGLHAVKLSSADISGPMSVKLIADHHSARLYVGGEFQQYVATVPFDRAGGCVSAGFSHNAKIQRLTAEARYVPVPEYAPFVSEDELRAYIAASADINEAVWDYLDRDIDPALATAGGRYRLATIKSASRPGTYDIIYLSGADAPDGREPMRVIGRLAPTIFIGAYSLDWFDTRGRLLSGDQDAQITLDHAILTLRWPLLRSQLRFSRSLVIE